MSLAPIADGISVKGLASGLQFYSQRFRLIATNLRSFPVMLGEPPNARFGEALRFGAYSVSIGFLLLLPSLLLFQQDTQKWAFFCRFIFNLFLIGLLLHLSIKIFDRNSRSLRDTLTMYFHMAGFGLVVSCIGLLPLTLVVGPVVILGGQSELPLLTEFFVAHSGFYYYMLAVLAIIAVMSWIMLISWIMKFYGIGFIKSIVSVLILGTITNILVLFAINPFFNEFGGHIERVLGTIL